MLPLVLFNVIGGLIMDKAQDLAIEHVEKMMDDILPENSKKELDKFISDDPSHPFTSAKEALVAITKGELDIHSNDNNESESIEVNFTAKYNPNTNTIDIIKK